MVDRRGVLIGAGAIGVGAIIAGCAGGSRPPSTSPATNGATDSGGAPEAKVSDVPVGGGTILTDADVVVTQPVAGQFKAFGATCTHRGCEVSKISDGTIVCPCHGSEFSITDGSVVKGPASQPLAEKTVSVQGDTVTVT